MFKVDRRAQWVVVHPAGEIDLAVADEFRATVLDALERADRVAIDFSEVTFLDSSGLGVIAAALKQTQNDGGQLIVVGLSERVRAVLEITGMTKILDIRDDLVAEDQFSVESTLTPAD
jgi:anti-anti-sigma factor